jgi:hypothetical protein
MTSIQDCHKVDSDDLTYEKEEEDEQKTRHLKIPF